MLESFGCLNSDNVLSDEMHLLFLGVCSFAHGSLLWLLSYVILSRDPETNLSQIWTDITCEYGRHGTPCQFSSLTLTMFINPRRAHLEYPKLRGRGAELKHLTPVLLQVFRKYKRPLDHDGWVEMLYEELTEMQERHFATSGVAGERIAFAWSCLAVAERASKLRSPTIAFTMRFLRLQAGLCLPVTSRIVAPTVTCQVVRMPVEIARVDAPYMSRSGRGGAVDSLGRRCWISRAARCSSQTTKCWSSRDAQMHFFNFTGDYRTSQTVKAGYFGRFRRRYI